MPYTIYAAKRGITREQFFECDDCDALVEWCQQLRLNGYSIQRLVAPHGITLGRATLRGILGVGASPESSKQIQKTIERADAIVTWQRRLIQSLKVAGVDASRAFAQLHATEQILDAMRRRVQQSGFT